MSKKSAWLLWTGTLLIGSCASTRQPYSFQSADQAQHLYEATACPLLPSELAIAPRSASTRSVPSTAPAARPSANLPQRRAPQPLRRRPSMLSTTTRRLLVAPARRRAQTETAARLQSADGNWTKAFLLVFFTLLGILIGVIGLAIGSMILAFAGLGIMLGSFLMLLIISGHI